MVQAGGQDLKNMLAIVEQVYNGTKNSAVKEIMEKTMEYLSRKGVRN